MINRQQMLSVHRDDNGVPDLRHENLQKTLASSTNTTITCTYLRLVLDLHLTRSKKLRVDSLRHPGEDLCPRGPNTEPKTETPPNTEDDEPDDVPEICVEEEQDQIHNVHDRKGKWNLISTQCTSEELVVTVLHCRPCHDRNGATERGCQEEIRLDKLAGENQEPHDDGCCSRSASHDGIRGSECLRCHVLS